MLFPVLFGMINFECFNHLQQKTLSSLELPRVVTVASGPSTPVSVGDSLLNENQDKTYGAVGQVSSSFSRYNGRQRQKGHDPARDISIQVLEKFSLVTKFARETTSQLFRENHSNGFDPFERKFDNQSVQNYHHEASYDTVKDSDAENVCDEIPVASDPLEVMFYFFGNFFSY